MRVKPRVGFLGVGWIGRHRMAAMLGAVEPVAFCDPSEACAAEAAALAPGAERAESLDGLLALNLDGLVIATPSALHAAQSIRALDAGVAVFCQKPLGRSAVEVRRVVDAARRTDRLLGVDLSYRSVAGMDRVRELVRGGALGRVFAADLLFHNAYGPDKAWFYDRARSGGGCLVDLGVHLVDLALWSLDFPAIEAASGTLFAGGVPLAGEAVEDYAAAALTLAGGVDVRLACSWRLHAGTPAVIAARFYGTQGGATVRNVDGSFHDFTVEHATGTSTTTLATDSDWGGRAAAAWAERLAGSPRFDRAADEFVRSADALDRIYAAAGVSA